MVKSHKKLCLHGSCVIKMYSIRQVMSRYGKHWKVYNSGFEELKELKVVFLVNRFNIVLFFDAGILVNVLMHGWNWAIE